MCLQFVEQAEEGACFVHRTLHKFGTNERFVHVCDRDQAVARTHAIGTANAQRVVSQVYEQAAVERAFTRQGTAQSRKRGVAIVEHRVASRQAVHEISRYVNKRANRTRVAFGRQAIAIGHIQDAGVGHVELLVQQDASAVHNHHAARDFDQSMRLRERIHVRLDDDDHSVVRRYDRRVRRKRGVTQVLLTARRCRKPVVGDRVFLPRRGARGRGRMGGPRGPSATGRERGWSGGDGRSGRERST